MNIGVVIPIYNLTLDRFLNFKFVLSRLSLSTIENINVIEQHSANTNVTDIIRLFGRVNYKRYNLKTNTFNKSKLLNIFFNSVNYDYVWMIDADVYMNYEYVINNLPSQFDFVRPFNQVVKLNKSNTQFTRNTAKVKIDSENLVINNHYGKYSYIIERGKFLEVGGYNEQFQGWGFQDLNLFNKINKKDNKIKYTQNNAFHLYHTKASKQYYQNNKKLFFEEI